MNIEKIILILCLGFMGNLPCSQDQQGLFLRGNELFMQEKYQDAFNVYQRIDDKGFVILYNMELCCLRLGNKAEALLYAKRAEKQASSYKELTLIDEVLELNEDGQTIITSWYEQLAVFCKKGILATSTLLVQQVVLGGLILLILCWYMQWYRRYRKLSILFLTFWLLFYYIWLLKLDFLEQKCGVVLEKSIPVFAGPDISFYKKAELSEASLVRVIDQRGQYYKIKVNKLVGWIDSHNLELV